MNHLEQIRQQIRKHLLLVVILENLVVISFWWLATQFSSINPAIIALISTVFASILASVIVFKVSDYVLQPLQAIWQAVLHLSPNDHGIAAPKIENLNLGQELVTSLTSQIYQLYDMAKDVVVAQKSDNGLGANFVAQNLPLPLLILDNTQTIIFANEVASKYIGTPVNELVGKNIYMVLDMAFPGEDTFDSWLKKVQITSATAVNSWERVRLNVRDNHPTLLFDLAAYYNRDNSDKMETFVVLFDHTKQYSQDDQAVSFIALSVHELRTPLTMLRGYIEVFEDEFKDESKPEMQDFMLKMKSSAEQLTAFVNNILNVARVDNDQLQLQLQESDWQSVLSSAVDAIALRAKVRGISIELNVAPDLPKVGVDSLSIREVINNLIDNAIKYSGNSKTIKIESHLTQDGLIETTVQDFGLGVSTSIVPNLFTKFYRDHRNRAQIGGTGLGLYLCKAIVTAHGGNIWIKSKEGEGSVFGFTLLPFANLTDELKLSGNKEIVRSAHGWIKNHSLYRR